MTHRILVADDNTDICSLLSRFLTRKGFEVETAFSGQKALELLKTQKFDLMICDFRLGDTDGLKMLEQIHEAGLTLPVIIITGYSDIKIAVNVIKAGAFDYVTKPLIPDEILMIINKALGNDNGAVKNGTASGKGGKRSSRYQYLVGKSDKAKELYKQIDLVAPTNYSVIIYGESGSGKEAVAQSIHDISNRSHMPFVAMDCGAISRELAGSELFGHEKGSFTGALTQKIGHFEMANGGTLFLDEISNLSYDIQVSLLRVVQERRLKRIGSTKELDLDVRILIASNENLADAYRKGKFREDLYHRFNEFVIDVPPLRDRKEDILYFAEFFLEQANKDLEKNIAGFTEEVKDAFNNYHWPGNIREMKNVVKRATLLSNDGFIDKHAIPYEIMSPVAHPVYHEHAIIAGAHAAIPSMPPVAKPPAHNLKEAALEAEYETIMNVLKQVQFNKSKAARLLKIDRKTLYNKMRHYNMISEKDEETKEQ
jgi:two-component system, NtrC family, response regulator HydG